MRRSRFFVFFFNDTATTEIYTLSLHDALPISWHGEGFILSNEELIAIADQRDRWWRPGGHDTEVNVERGRSEEHTSELQSQSNLVCRLLLEKKKSEPSTDNVPHS